MTWIRTVLMGDPAHFSVRGGANPHTRTRWGTRRSVDRELAIAQWGRLRDTLVDLGVRVWVVPPDPAQPGLVYPANAGFMSDVDTERDGKTFFLSNLLPTRAGEKEHYRRFLEAKGVRLGEFDRHYRFEGEADFFPVAGAYVFTCGRLERQRFVPAWRIPPWRRVYGFRSDARLEPRLAAIVEPHPLYKLELVKEAHYHGDTALCAFGPRREHLLAYVEALAPGDRARLVECFGSAAVIPLEEDDARRYAANSFTFTRDEDSFLVMPEGVSARLLDQVRERDVTPICVDVSEFLKKGGGSVKCMIGDLGPLRGEERGEAAEA